MRPLPIAFLYVITTKLLYLKCKCADEITADDIESFFKQAQSVGNGDMTGKTKPNDEDYYDLINADGHLDNSVSHAVLTSQST